MEQETWYKPGREMTVNMAKGAAETLLADGWSRVPPEKPKAKRGRPAKKAK